MQQIVHGMKSTRSVVWWKSLVNGKIDDETCGFDMLRSCNSIIAGNPFWHQKRANDIISGTRKLRHVATFLTDFTVDGGSSHAWVLVSGDEVRTTTGLPRFFEVLVGETVKARWMEKCLKHHSCAYHSHVKMGGLGLPMFTTKSLAIKAMNIPNFGKQNDATKCWKRCWGPVTSALWLTVLAKRSVKGSGTEECGHCSQSGCTGG